MIRRPPRSTLDRSSAASDVYKRQPIPRLTASQSPVFLVNSRHPLLCATPIWLPKWRSPFSRSYGGILPSSFNVVLSSALVCSTCPPVSVWGTVLLVELFPGTSRLHAQSVKHVQLSTFVTTTRLRNINLIPIDYGFRPRLRGRLTLGGLTLPRNPWAYGESVSHTLCRYSCQHSHFRYLQHPSQDTFTGLRNAPLPCVRRHILSFGVWLEPRYIFGAGRLI